MAIHEHLGFEAVPMNTPIGLGPGAGSPCNRGQKASLAVNSSKTGACQHRGSWRKGAESLLAASAPLSELHRGGPVMTETALSIIIMLQCTLVSYIGAWLISALGEMWSPSPQIRKSRLPHKAPGQPAFHLPGLPAAVVCVECSHSIRQGKSL